MACLPSGFSLTSRIANCSFCMKLNKNAIPPPMPRKYPWLILLRKAMQIPAMPKKANANLILNSLALLIALILNGLPHTGQVIGIKEIPRSGREKSTANVEYLLIDCLTVATYELSNKWPTRIDIFFGVVLPIHRCAPSSVVLN